VDVSKHGGRNPLIDAAREISITPKRGAKDDEDSMGSEHEEEKVGGPVASGKIPVDAEGNVPGAALGAQDAPAGGPGNEPGSYEAFMMMFGGGGNPPPRGPVPS
jgi:hypothetical protein